MIKNIKMLLFFIKISIMRDMVYRFNFIVNMLTDFTYNIIKVVLFEVIFSNVQSLGGLSKYEVLFILGSSFIVDSLYMMFNFFNHIQISEQIRMGQLDFYITKPVTPWFMLSYKQFNLAGVGNLFFGIYMICNSLIKLDHFQINWGLYILFLLCGYLIYSSISLLLFTTAFWTVKTDGFIGMMVDMTEIMKYPHSIFPRALQFLFTFILPVFVIVSHPSYIILKQTNWLNFIGIIIITFIFTSLTISIFTYAIKKYKSAN